MRLLFYLRRALQLPPHEVVRRGWAILRAEFNGFTERRRERRAPTYAPGPAAFPLASFLRPLPAGLLRPHTASVTRLAEDALAHRFDLLGSGPVVVRHGMDCRGRGGHRYPPGPAVAPDPRGDWLRGRVNAPNLPRSAELWRLVSPAYAPIDWSLDFISGHRWPETTYYHDVRDSVRPGVDIKVPWELARMQHLPALAWAHALAAAGQPSLRPPADYVREFEDQVLDFLATNPPRYGVNWKCPMDVAIRAAGWLLTRDLFVSHGAAFRPAFDAALARAVYEHGLHIASHPEWGPDLRANHYLADLAGLVFIGAYLTRSPEADLWLAFSLVEFATEVALQFSPDGSSFEASTSYHRLSAEMAAYATALALALPAQRLRAAAATGPAPVRPGPVPPLTLWETRGTDPVPFPPEHFRRLQAMANFTLAVASATGRVPQIGDNDNGRFLRLWPAFRAGEDPPTEDALSHRHLVAALNAFCGRDDLAAFAGDAAFETEVVRALAGEARLDAIRLATRPAPPEVDRSAALTAFRDFGLFIYRPGRFSLWVRCGPVGQNGNGGHAHNDQLSFELHLDGVPVFVDPGTFVYTPLPEERNRFRATASHNTLALDGHEQNAWLPGRLGLFMLQDRARARVLEAAPGVFVGEHVGFGATHRRALRIGESIAGSDGCAAPGARRLLFHLAPDVRVIDVSPTAGVHLEARGLGLTLSADAGEWSVSSAWYSPAYGVRLPTTCCEFRFSGRAIDWRVEAAPAPLLKGPAPG